MNMNIFESHAHYDDKAFEADLDDLLNQLKESGITRVVNVGASLESCKTTIALMEKYDFVYGAMGVHPSETAELNEENFAWLKEQCSMEKCVAVGEIGLDYYWKEPEKDIQVKWFERQMELSKEVKLPIIIHSRDAAKDTLDMMKACNARESGGVIHCFSYGTEMAREYLNMGFYLGIGGVVTFNNAKKLKEVVEYVPLNSILIETDSPYLAPVPNRGKRNSSLNLPYIIETIAKLKGVSTEEVAMVTYQNAKNMFGIE